jgi:hypothetical protein
MRKLIASLTVAAAMVLAASSQFALGGDKRSVFEEQGICGRGAGNFREFLDPRRLRGFATCSCKPRLRGALSSR